MTSCKNSGESEESENDASKKDPGYVATPGSCVGDDTWTTGSLKICIESNQPLEQFKAFCNNLYDGWSADACKKSNFKQKCTIDFVTSIDGDSQNYTNNYYIQDRSDFFCIGEKSTVDISGDLMSISIYQNSFSEDSLSIAAQGYYSNNSTKDITQTVAWSSDDINAISIGSNGEIGYSESRATANITAQLDNVSKSVKLKASVGHNLRTSTSIFTSGVLTGLFSYTYDSRGNLLLNEYYAPDGESIKSKYVYTYDVFGNKLSYSYYNYSISESLFSRSVYTYDENGNNLSRFDYGTDGITLAKKVVNTYDSDGNQLASLTYNSDGITLTDKILKTYDNAGNRLTYSVYEADGVTLIMKYLNTFDSNGNMLTNSLYGTDGVTLSQKSIFTYDSYGNSSSTSRYLADGISLDWRSVSTYDINNNLLSSRYYNTDGVTLKYKFLYAYDDYNNRTVYSYYSDGVTLTSQHIISWGTKQYINFF